MRRRELIALLGSTVTIWPLAAWAQQANRSFRVGVLWHAASAEEEDVYLNVVTKAFSDLGYIDGRSIQLEHHFPAERPERFRAFARDMVESRVDVILAVTSLGAKEAKQATSTIPVVFVLDADPVSNGLVESLARPGGNLTGLSLMSNDVSGKRVALFKELVPNLSRMAIMVDPRDPAAPRIRGAYERASQALSVSTESFELTTPDEIEQTFSAIAQSGFHGVALASPLLFNERRRIGTAALGHKLPTLSLIGEMVPHGLLLSYGQDFPDYFRRAVGLIDKILKGAKPGDLPVEQPTRFKLTINQKVARTLGLTIPQSLLIGADEIID
ncbi:MULTISPECIES: ABC transporter substrate-binding protein [unclassified Bradyrhizobium]|uniref:ABC transporter substrate-binding protein n=1 Tax=Bradyrhizobium TaxID=374 RepID=UPI001CD337BF|nr:MULTISPECIES: ABC transporter substrate-binding protein [unclassified Bradyrhizobium]MCA1497610.1 ABC transporter substrate-binding protein [Bradyrhizobium sp. NBAIM14]MCA1534327.1 ABC transporter substrate-binding protein [Bradyrhizobium sp. NBAIM03]